MKPWKLILVLVLLCSISVSVPVSASESGENARDILQVAYQNDIPQIAELAEEQYVEVVYDSRYDSSPIILPKAVPSSYDYYKTYRTGVTCKGSGQASSYLLDANITFYVNVFFKSTNAVGYESPVVTGVSGVYGATGFSSPSVKVTSWSAKKMTFKGTCKLKAGGTYTMTGTKTISLP